MEFIPKHYCLSDKIFWSKPLIDWTYSDTILLTAYDLLNNDPLIYYLQSNSLTLSELLKENGFPADTKILADTGIFSLEFRKYVRGRTFKQDYSTVNIETDEIIEIYKLIDPDFLVAPDEIILFRDSPKSVKKKVDKMKNNLRACLDCFNAKKVIGVIQGITFEVIDEFFDFYKEQGITHFARGGLIPISWKKELFCKVLNYTRTLTSDYPLHAFGVSNLDIVRCYTLCSSVDSFDSTIVKALTSDLYYLTPSLRKVRFDDQVIADCSCPYCNELRESVQDISYDFASIAILVNLYLHNITTVTQFCSNPPNYTKKFKIDCQLD
ncbi:MAG: hypothetical protein ACTSQE_10440 [Candidatus Heimdallarchaeaceae archaeon]